MKVMDFKFNHMFCAAILVALSSCAKIDNYDAPDGGLSGRLVDRVTGEVVYQPVNSDGGLRVQLTQQDWIVEADPQFFYAREDGTFTNSRLFSGEYLLDFGQANFFPVDEIPVTIAEDGMTEVEVAVTPFCTVYMDDVVFENRAVRATARIKRTWNWVADNRGCKITGIGLCCHISPNVDYGSDHNIGTGEIDCSGTEDLQLLTGEGTFEVNLVLDGTRLQQYAHVIKANGNRLYVRAFVETQYGSDLRYNYSAVSTVTVE